MVSYKPLWDYMRKKSITTYTLIHKYGFSSKTIYNLKHDKGITMYTLEKLCNVLQCEPSDVFFFVKCEEKIQNSLMDVEE